MFPNNAHLALIQDIFNVSGDVELIHEAMGSSDISDVVVTTLQIMQKRNMLPVLKKHVKSKEISKQYRLNADNALENRDMQKALELYNLALMYAPINSNAMKLTYCKRSAVFLKIEAYDACLRDVERCLLLGDSSKVDDKLKEIKSEAVKRKNEKKKFESTMMGTALISKHEPTEESKTYFKFNENRNPDIPCASTNIEVQFESTVPKIVASTYIKTGTVLALESPFMSNANDKNSMYSCYYCEKINLNLIPCSDCCFAMFCDDKCMKLCLEEFHHIECQIVHILHLFFVGNAVYDLALKAMLKIKSKCTWDEFIKESYNYGNSRRNKSSLRELYDTQYKFSLLNCKEDKPFIFGEMYNYSSIAAVTILALASVESFLPQTPAEKSSAIRAVSRILMYLVLYNNAIEMVVPSSTAPGNIITSSYLNFGLFSFTGKLNNSHLPNVIPVGLTNKLALVTVQPIKKGEELMIPYWGFWTVESSIRTNENILLPNKVLCNCILCSETWKLEKNNDLTDTQINAFLELQAMGPLMNIGVHNLFKIYSKICKLLTMFQDKPYTKEYKHLLEMFKFCIQMLQNVAKMNSDK